MTVVRVSRDYETLGEHFSRIIAIREKASVPEGYAPWIGHLAELQTLLSVDRGIARHLTIDEIRGLALFRQIANDTESKSRACPRCRQRTEALYNCEHCGMRLN